MTTLIKLSMHTDSQVRAAVAENTNLSLKTVWRLARDEHADVRMRTGRVVYSTTGGASRPFRGRKSICREPRAANYEADTGRSIEPPHERLIVYELHTIR